MDRDRGGRREGNSTKRGERDMGGSSDSYQVGTTGQGAAAWRMSGMEEVVGDATEWETIYLIHKFFP